MESPNRIVDEIKDKVQEASSKVAGLRNIHIQVTDRVARAFIMKLEKLLLESKDRRIPLLLKREEVNDIANDLAVDGAYGYQTWLHRDALNILIFELKRGKVLNPTTPFYQVAQKLQRRLIVNVEQEVWEHTLYVRKLRDNLLICIKPVKWVLLMVSYTSSFKNVNLGQNSSDKRR